MSSYNKVILLGNLTRDPEIRYTPNGIAIANFAIAVNRKYKQGDGYKDETSYIDIVVMGKQAEACGQYIAKGNSILIDGRLQQRRWETEEGQKRNKLEVVAQSVNFMPKKGGGNGSAPESGDASGYAEQPASPVNEDDIPF